MTLLARKMAKHERNLISLERKMTLLARKMISLARKMKKHERNGDKLTSFMLKQSSFAILSETIG